MELKKALALRTEYEGTVGVIRVDSNDYVCLNEMVAFFPGRSIEKWAKAVGTKEFARAVEKEFKLPPNGGIIGKKGKGGGTWAHPMIAFEFATWLSPEFKLKVYKEYVDGTQRKENWNIKRIMAANHYKFMTDAINEAHDPAKHYHYSNEALMLNEIVFGVRDGNVRDTATEEQLDLISSLEMHNATLISIGWDYHKRKDTLQQMLKDDKVITFKPKNNILSLEKGV